MAHAATITADGTTCTLVDAITAANSDSATNGCSAGSGDDIIQLPSSGTVTLTSANETDPDGYGAVGLPPITSNITIEGNGTTITRSGGNNFRLFYVKSGGSLTLQNLTLSNGFAQGGNGGDGYEGGGGGALGAGGAIFNRGTLTTSGVTFSSNSAQGGNGGTDPGSAGEGGGGGGMGGDGATGNNTGGTGGNGGGLNGGSGGTSSNNSTNGGIGGGGGGGSGSGAVGRSGGFGGGGGGGPGGAPGGFGGGGGGSFNGSVGGFGGGNGNGWGGGGGLGAGGAIFNDSGTVNITNTTFSGNTAQGGNGGNGDSTDGDGGSGFGGALFNYNGTVTVNNATFASQTVGGGTGNSAGSAAGGGIYNHQESGSANLTLKNTILADTTSGTDCENNAGTVTAPAANSNLIESHSGCGTPAVTTDPNLGSLADNGGPTFTHALPVGSSAIDAGDTATSRTILATGCLASDGSTIARDQRNAPRAQGANSGDASCDIGAYEYNSIPLAVTLASLQALATGEQVVVTWQTVSEVYNLGFNLYRASSLEGAQEQLNRSLIPAQAPGSGQGAAYEWQDEEVVAGTTYYYWVADVDLNGVETRHGPVSATATTPTAIRLDSFQNTTTWPLWALLALTFALLVGGWRMLRRMA